MYIQTRNKTVREIIWHLESAELTYNLQFSSVNLVSWTILASFYHLLLVFLAVSSTAIKAAGRQDIHQENMINYMTFRSTSEKKRWAKRTMKSILFKLNLARQNFLMHKRSPISNMLSTTLIRYRKRSTRQVFTLSRTKHGTRHTQTTTELPYYLSPTPVIPTADRASGKHHESLNHDTPAWRGVRATGNEGWCIVGGWAKVQRRRERGIWIRGVERKEVNLGEDERWKDKRGKKERERDVTKKWGRGDCRGERWEMEGQKWVVGW